MVSMPQAYIYGISIVYLWYKGKGYDRPRGKASQLFALSTQCKQHDDSTFAWTLKDMAGLEKKEGEIVWA